MTRRTFLLHFTLIASLIVPLSSASAASAKPRKFKNCDAMHRVHEHGVGRPGARDKTSGERVTSFKVNRSLYKRNRHLDRDKDGIACEQD